jgi:hypothetical protein
MMPAPVAPPPAAAPPVPVVTVANRPGEPGWSRSALRRLGLPDAILDLLTVAEDAGDSAWTMDLVGALLAVLAQELSAAAPADGTITVSGHGATAAFGLIRAAADGARPALLHLAGGDVPATAMELALAVRSCLPR